MRLNVDFRQLDLVSARFKSDRRFELDDLGRPPLEPIDVELERGIEISLDELENSDGLLSYKGRHVILYIRDHGYRVVDAINDPARSGKKFHVADCETLEMMRSKNRFDRYVVTQAVTGDFEIAGTDSGGRPYQGSARLQVCINCLKKLNYKSSLLRSSIRKAVRDEFSLLEFFETYSTRFRTLPRALAGQGDVGYTQDWPELSKRLREASGYRCEDCRVCLEQARSLLHVHHVNGVKGDNRPANLQVLCKDCHRKQPDHGHIFMPEAEMRTLETLRKQQGLVPSTWEAVLKRVDLASRPSLELAAHRGWEVPELSAQLKAADGRAVHAEAVWTKRRHAMISDVDQLNVPGWKTQRPGALLQELTAEM